MALITLVKPSPQLSLDDLVIVENGLQARSDRDEVSFFWYNLREWEDGRRYDRYRVVRLVELRFLPQEARNDAGLVAKTRSAVTGLYQSSARFDLLQVVAGIFSPPLGIVQCYGVASAEPTLDEAIAQSELGLASLKAVLANFVQSEFVPLNTAKSEWLLRAMVTMKHSLVAIGHPDPRQNPRGGGRESPDEQRDLSGQGAYTLQQNEMLFRGMSKLQEEFLWVLMAHRVDRARIAQMLAGIAAEASAWASRVSGVKGISFGISVPIMLSGSIGHNAGSNYGESDTQSAGHQVTDSHGTTHQEGTADTTSHEVSHGTSHQWGVAQTTGKTISHSDSIEHSTSHTDGTNESWGAADTHGVTKTDSSSTAHMPSVTSTSHSSVTTNVPNVVSASNSHTDTSGVSTQQGVSSSVSHGESSAQGVSDTTSHTDTQTDGQSVGASVGGQVGVGLNESVDGGIPANTLHGALGSSQSASVSGSVSAEKSSSSSDADSVGHTQSQQQTQSEGQTVGVSAAVGSSQAVADSVGQNVAQAHTITSGGVTTTTTPGYSVTTHSSSVAVSNSHTDSHEVGKSAADTTGQSKGHSDGDAISVQETHSEGWGESWGEAWGAAHTVSQSDTESWGTSRGLSIGRSFGTAIGRSLGMASSMGISGGVVPSVTATKSYNWMDDGAAQVTQLLRTQEQLLDQAAKDGAFLTDVYLLTRTPTGRAAAEALVRQSFHGDQLVVTSVQTRRLDKAEQEYIRLHTSAFTPSTRVETVPGLLEGYKDSTLLTPLQVAAYLAPGMFEQGTATTTQERIPPFAFYPEMEGDVVLAHQWMYETRTLTQAQVRLAQDRHFHTAFIGDTGVGKTVAAERLCVETALKWHHRNIVLDFGSGWRELLLSPLPKSRVDIWQLYPGAVRPLRWNFLQVGRRISPNVQFLAVTELVATAGQMGPRQLGFLRRALRELYLERGVLTTDREVLGSEVWGRVRDSVEASVGGAPVGTPLRSLMAQGRQALAVHRSKQVDVNDWVDRLRAYLDALDKKDTQNYQSLLGVILRLELFTQGEMGLMYGKGEGSIAIEDLGLLGPEDDQWGVAVLEGGASLDPYAKSVLLGMIAWHLYNDAVVRRREAIGGQLATTPALRAGASVNIFFEEANKILSGVPVAGVQADESGGRGIVSDQYQIMFREGRKNRVFCHILLQSVAEIAPGIFSSCANLFLGQTKATQDRDMALAHMARSEKGFTDEEYKRFVSRMPKKMAVCKLGYAEDLSEMEPILVQPIRIAAREPTEAQVMAWYHARYPELALAG
jgi:hypothetical protein